MVSMSITEVLLMLQDMIAAVADCFSALKVPVTNLPIVFPINREISLFCGPSTWKLWYLPSVHA